MGNKLRVGIIGLGVGKAHAQSLLDCGNADVVALCDFDEDRLNQVSVDYPDCRTTIDATSILEDQNIDMVSIAAYDNYHYSYVVQALNNGKHIFVEKPICLCRSELEKINLHLQRSEKICLSSNHVLRTVPVFLDIKDKITKGEFGNIYCIEGDYLWGRFEKLDGWRANIENYSLTLGGAIHLVDLVMWLVGQKPSRVFALGNKLGASQAKLRQNSFVSTLLEFPSGLVVKISAHGGCLHPHYHSLSVFGEKLTALHRFGDPVWISSCDASIAPVRIASEYPAKNKYKKIICNFVESIVSSDTKALVSAQEVFDATSVCMAVDDSIKRQEPIIVDYVG